MKINNIILLLYTPIILSSFVIYIFCICHSGSFPIVYSFSIFSSLCSTNHVDLQTGCWSSPGVWLSTSSGCWLTAPSGVTSCHSPSCCSVTTTSSLNSWGTASWWERLTKTRKAPMEVHCENYSIFLVFIWLCCYSHCHVVFEVQMWTFAKNSFPLTLYAEIVEE